MKFLSNDDCLNYLAARRWDGIVISPFSPTSKVYHCPNSKFKCQLTGKYFNAKTGTIFANSRISLLVWFKAIEILISDGDITSTKLSKMIGVSQKTAWLIQNKIRPHKLFLISHDNDKEPISDLEKLNLLDWLILHKNG